MNEPRRSEVLARASEPDVDLPRDFARRVAALARAEEAARRARWQYAALAGAFVMMLGVCVAVWKALDPQGVATREWIEPIFRLFAAQPWLLVGAAGIAWVQLLNFRRRAFL